MRSVDRFLADESAMRALAGTPPVAALDPHAFDAVFLPSGHGTMWDLPESAALANLLTRAWA